MVGRVDEKENAVAAAHLSETMTDQECWQRLAAETIGRVAISVGDSPRIFPVNHLVHDGIVSFRTGPGEKTDASWAHPKVAFEVDGSDETVFWSVVVQGTSTMVADDDPSLPAAVRALVPLDPSPKHIVVSIAVDQISGRQFPRPATTG